MVVEDRGLGERPQASIAKRHVVSGVELAPNSPQHLHMRRAIGLTVGTLLASQIGG